MEKSKFKAGDKVRVLGYTEAGWEAAAKGRALLALGSIHTTDGGTLVEGYATWGGEGNYHVFELVEPEVSEEEDEGLDAEDLLEMVVEELRIKAREFTTRPGGVVDRVASVLGYRVQGNTLVEVEWTD